MIRSSVTLGHYLTALVLMHQQTGDAECRRRADYLVAALAEAQAKRGTGYVGALGRKRKGESAIVDGEEIFPEIMRGEIRSGGFDLSRFDTGTPRRLKWIDW